MLFLSANARRFCSAALQLQTRINRRFLDKTRKESRLYVIKYETGVLTPTRQLLSDVDCCGHNDMFSLHQEFSLTFFLLDHSHVSVILLSFEKKILSFSW